MRDALVTLDLALADKRGWPGAKPNPPAPSTPPTQAAYALVNHGRWIVVCPCGAASLAPESPALAYCSDCGNWQRVLWPAPAVRAQVERDLLALPGFRHKAPQRNWEPEVSSGDSTGA